MDDHTLRSARSVADAARTLHQSRTLDETLQTIVEVARRSVPGFDQVGITVLERGRQPQTRVHDGDLVLELDHLQYDLEEGPCVETLRGQEVVSALHLSHDQRWPRYVPDAARRGVRSQLGLRLHVDQDGTLGALNLYSTTSDDIPPDSLAVAELFATHASIALGYAQEREGLTTALQSRKVIGQAIGILMERYEMNEDRAFAFLVRASSHGNLKLRDIAQELVDQRNRS